MKTSVRILIAGHDPADLELIEYELKKDGLNYEAEIHKTEEGYTNALKTFRPHIILSDFTFPSFNGHTAFEIRQKLAPSVPFILVSGTIGEERVVELIRNGATDYVLKDRMMSLPLIIGRALRDAKEQLEKNETTIRLQDAMADLENIMDSTLDVICTINKSGEFVTVNAASEWNWGYKPEDLSGKPFLDFVFAEDIERTAQVDKSTLNSLSLTKFENRYVHKNGSIVPMLWSSKWDTNNELNYCVGKNATETKRLEQATEHEQQRFYNLFAQAPSAIGILKGPRHVYEMTNPFYRQLIGKQDIIGKSVQEVLPEVVKQGFVHILDEVYSTGKPFFANEKLLKLNVNGAGKLVDVYLNIAYQAHRNTAGDIEGIFFFINDVTEQVVSRKKIDKSENQYRQIVDTTQEGIWLIDENDLTTLVNKKMCEIIGFEKNELLQQKIYDFMDAESRKNSVKQIERRKQGFSEIHDAAFITKTGSEILVNISTNPIFDDGGNYKGALAMVTDITKRKNVEAELIKRDSQLTLAAEIAKLGYWEYDLINDVFYFTDEFYAIFKTTAEKVGGYTMSSARYTELFVHPDDQEIVARSIADAIKSNESTFCFKAEHRMIYADGNTGYISVHFFIVKDQQGNTVKNYGVNQDITSHKLSQIRLNEMNSNLQQQTKKLALSNAELEQFAYVASHDLQEPLRMVISFLALLEKKYKDVIDEKGQEYISFAVGGAKRMKQLVIDILDFSKVGRSEDRLEPVDIVRVVEDIKLVLRKQVREHNASFQIGALPVIHAYKSSIDQVFQNLISNALKYTSENSAVSIQINAVELENHWQFSVADNGIGIKKEYFSKIFSIFQRLHSSSQYSGTGIGLAIAKKQILNMGGEIWLTSEPGEGSTFYFTIAKKLPVT